MPFDLRPCASRGFAAAAALLLLPLRLAAQVDFRWPAAEPEVERYTRIEECVAAAERLRDSVWTWGGPLHDTLPYDPAEPLPAVAVEAARRCSRRFPVEQTARDELSFRMRLALLAGQDAEAQAAVRRQVAALPATALDQRAQLWVQAIHTYLRSQPVRLALATEAAAELDRLPNAWRWRLEAHGALAMYADQVADTGLTRRELAALRAIAAEAPDTGVLRSWRRSQIGYALPGLAPIVLRDSGTAGYERFTRAAYAESSRKSPDQVDVGLLGRPAPPLTGDFWFARGDTTVPRPTKGKVSLVVFVDHRVCACRPEYAVLRRLARRFPALDITLVTRTFGYFQRRPPLAPAEEAEAIRRLLHDRIELPGALSISITPFTRMPAPDDRRLNGRVVNFAAYGLEESGRPEFALDRYASVARDMPVFLVDRDGLVAYQGNLNPRAERKLNAVVEAVLVSGARAAR